MKPLMHLGLLLMTLLGVIGQSTAMAMVPAHQTMRVSMAGMDCMDVANRSAPGKSPCKKVTLQCMVALGCPPYALVAPSAHPAAALVADRNVSTPSVAARLWGRTYGPEPDPPSFLI